MALRHPAPVPIADAFDTLSNEAPTQPAGRRSLLRTVFLAGACLAAWPVLLPAPAGAVGPPTADFSFSPATPVAGRAVRFDASATTETAPGAPAAADYDWDLDDDGQFDDAEGVVVTHTFATPGNHTVSLRVIGSDGVSEDVATKVVGVSANRPPVASFSSAPVRPVVGQTVRFATNAFDPDGRVVNVMWDLDGDRQFDDAVGLSAVTAFSSPGTRLLSIRVVDDLGAVTIAHLVLAVDEAPPPSLGLMSPFPIVRLAGTVTRRGTRVRVLSVSAPAGSKIVVRCRGRRCPKRRAATRARRTGRAVRIRSFQRGLRAGVRLYVYVTGRDVIGKYTRFVIRRRRPPRRLDGCLRPGSSRRVACPRR